MYIIFIHKFWGKKGMSIMLTAQKQIKLDVITKVSLGKLTIEKASQILCKSTRQILRYLASYKINGVKFLIHGNENKIPANKISDALKIEIQKLVKTNYYDFNMLHCLQKVKEVHGYVINRETFRIWCHEIKMVKRKKRRSSKARYLRQRMAQKGMML